MSLARAAAQLLLPGYINQGLSANAILRKLKLRTDILPHGVGYRRTLLLQDVRRLKGQKVSQDRLKHVRKDRIPTTSTLAPGKPAHGRKYQFKVEVQFMSAVSGNLEKQYITLTTDKRWSVKTLESMAEDIVTNKVEEAGDSSHPGAEIVSSRLDSGLFRQVH